VIPFSFLSVVDVLLSDCLDLLLSEGSAHPRRHAVEMKERAMKGLADVG
jgi:hypothetical protein